MAIELRENCKIINIVLSGFELLGQLRHLELSGRVNNYLCLSVGSVGLGNL